MGRTTLITTVALAAAFAVPATAGAATYEQLRPQQGAGDTYTDLRSPDARDAARASDQVAYQDLRSPDARDVGREPNKVVHVPEPVVQIREEPGFDWGDAGIGAAGILAMVSIAAGLMLLVGGRRRRRDMQTAH